MVFPHSSWHASHEECVIPMTSWCSRDERRGVEYGRGVIVAAAVSLLECAAKATDDEVVAACVATFAWRQRCLVRGLGALLDGLLASHK